jgi:hypothetical protein
VAKEVEDVIIDRKNWPANRPQPGDRVLNARGEEVAEVVRLGLDRDSGLRRILVRSLVYGHEYLLGQRWQSWERWFEDGGRLLRR